MSILDVTYHSTDWETSPRMTGSDLIPILPPQSGNSEQLDFSSGTDEGAAQSAAIIANVVADADCRVAVGVSITATTANSRLIKANQEAQFWIPAGARISVKAP